MKAKSLIILLIIFLISSCDKGLSPDLAHPKVGFGGKVTFSGIWNIDVKETHVILFKTPLNTVDDFNIFNLKYVSENIPIGISEYQYSTNDISLISAIEQGDYAYLAVAQSKSDTLSLNRIDWIVAGIYYTNNDSSQPGILNIPNGSYVDEVNIHCDFNNPPPQPPGGVDNMNLLKIFLNNN